MIVKALYKTFFVVFVFFSSSCATIIGGSKYYAHVYVENHPNASISYKGVSGGYGSAVFKVPRSEANHFTITVSEENCAKQNFTFQQRKIRGWALAGTILGWTSIISGIPVPIGLFVDLGTGALWRPDIMEKGVSKIDIKNYNYIITNYNNCAPKEKTPTPIPNDPGNSKTKTDRLFELKILLDRGILTQEEFDKEKKKILDEP
jgi:hypothetical protein